MFINNAGGGLAGNKEVEEGTTVSQLFDKEVGGGKGTDNYTIKVNRDLTTGDYVLKEGDRVSVTPNKVDGA